MERKFDVSQLREINQRVVLLEVMHAHMHMHMETQLLNFPQKLSSRRVEFDFNFPRAIQQKHTPSSNASPIHVIPGGSGQTPRALRRGGPCDGCGGGGGGILLPRWQRHSWCRLCCSSGS